MTKDIIILKHNNKICGYYLSKVAAENFINNCISCNFIKNTDKIELEYYNINSNICNKKEIINKINNKSIKVNKEQYEDFSVSEITSDSDSDSESYIKKKNKNKYNIKDENKYNIKDENKYVNEVENHVKEQILDNDSDSEKKLVLNLESDDSFTIDAEAFLNQKKKERENQHKIIEVGQQKLDILSHINKLKLEKQKMIENKTKYEYDLKLYEKFKQIKQNNVDFIIPLMFIDKYELFQKLENSNDLSFESFSDNYSEEQIKTKYEDMFAYESPTFKLPKPEDFKSENIDTLLSAAF